MDSRGLGKREGGVREPPGVRGGASLTAPPSCPSVLDAAGLARSLFDRLWQACGQWQQQVPAAAQAPQRQWLVSAHAIRNARRRMEDRHVCLPAFNLLFGLEVSGGPGWARAWEGTLVPSGAVGGSPGKRDARGCHKHLPPGSGQPGSSAPPPLGRGARGPPQDTPPPAQPVWW